MKTLNKLFFLSLTGLIAACDAPPSNSVSTSQPVTVVVQSAPIAAAAPAQAVQRSIRVSSVRVSVPKTLVVNEANEYYPKGDIVWREDPPGDRHAQVKAIFDAAMHAGTRSFRGSVPVRLDIEVRRFHALSQKARYSIGGVHAITFTLVVRDLRNGQVIGTPRVVRADLKALGGSEAIAADAQGLTQKRRITSHLAKVIQQELTQAGGYKNKDLGYLQRVNES